MSRKQSGCVVYRVHSGKLELLLISSSSDKKWVFPKGGVESDLTKKQSAIKEVWEEAGVTGKIVDKLGEFRYVKDGKGQKVVMYSMKFKANTATWPEEGRRTRVWVSAKKARKMVKPELRVFIDRLESLLMDDTPDVIGSLSSSGEYEGSRVLVKVDDGVGANTKNREFQDLMKSLKNMEELKDATFDVHKSTIIVRLGHVELKVTKSLANPHAKVFVIRYVTSVRSGVERVGKSKLNETISNIIERMTKR